MLTEITRSMLTRSRVLALALVALAPLAAQAAEEGGFPPAGNDIENVASLQRGARNFMNYCSGCHSAQYVRYNRVAADIGLTDKELRANLVFNPDTKSSDTIRAALAAQDAKAWFGTLPPDLSLMARARGSDYLYAFLRSFYSDGSRRTGVNNTVLPGTAMPHVLAGLQGVQTAVFEDATVKGDDGKDIPVKKFVRFAPGTPGTLSAADYDSFVRDTVNFLQYMGEPAQAKRESLGVWVLLFLLVFTAFAYGMKKEFWRDVH